ncbi:MAG: glutamate-1-semialdehyde 2,1-aminomutase [Candidatus Sumerlaeota bacterium]|nr:glutamate-1-semialdehyde 2,1-aminomutase [Candidatus Sumerlaeota bacterium]
MKHSLKLHHRALELMPGGVNSPVRAFGAVGGTPIYIASGQGTILTDISGKKYVDYVGSWGPLILGHAHPAVIEAVTAAARKGLSFGAPTEAEVLLAEKVFEDVPAVEMLRMVSSGTEATMSALRLARGATGRPKIIKFAGGYHGHADALLVKAGSGAMTFGVPSSPGVTEGVALDTLVCRYNDAGSVEEAFKQHPKEIAAVIVEPVAGNMGCVPPREDFLETLREITFHHGALLIYDEVITGFRVALGGAQQLYKQEPDLSCFGKILGGGMPVGAYGGRRELMEKMAPVGPIYQAGTLSGNPVTMAAGLATLKELEKSGVYERLEHLGALMEKGLRAAAQEAGVPVYLTRVGSMIGLFFTETPVHDFESALKSDAQRYAKFFHAMLDRGHYLAPSAYETLFVSLAHDEELIGRTIEAAREAMKAL